MNLEMVVDDATGALANIAGTDACADLAGLSFPLGDHDEAMSFADAGYEATERHADA
ncbi:hypothetical protein ABIE38_003523 [Dietzia sp. 2505]|uniref:hypothetical protein n=1 Tax=unclassified Dietzia TaxID=2617939 RepID=UPI0015FE6215|nr:hypothetical protein [Dietzia sp. B44]MBB1052818.1 hypothetical protein [Dietzia sp. B44]